MFKSLIILSFLFAYSASAKMYKIGVIDSGYDMESTWPYAHRYGLKKPKLCKSGHKHFAGYDLKDNFGHGTNVTGIISSNLDRGVKYCIIIVKAFEHEDFGPAPDNAIGRSVKYLTALKVDIINISGGGPEFILSEYRAVKKALDRGIVIVAAAGNNSEKTDYVVAGVKPLKTKQLTNAFLHSYQVTYKNIRTLEHTSHTPPNAYYPANIDERVINVGSIRNKTYDYSNYGDAVDVIEDGNGVRTLGVNNSYQDVYGTSMSTPLITARVINYMHKKSKKTK